MIAVISIFTPFFDLITGNKAKLSKKPNEDWTWNLNIILSSNQSITYILQNIQEIISEKTQVDFGFPVINFISINSLL